MLRDQSPATRPSPGGAPHPVDVGVQHPEAFSPVTGDDAVAELHRLAEPLRGRRLLQLNATSYGGGVSELLRSLVPLLSGLGLDAEWRVIAADAPFFQVTKMLHNALQGSPEALSAEERETYLASNASNAAMLEDPYDFVFINDPQPAAIRHFAPNLGRHWVWQCHIDTSEPQREAWEFLRPFIQEYDAAIFTKSEFIPPDLAAALVEVIPPAIDPLSPKNMPIPRDLARRILDWVGLRGDRPLITQVSRFDRWKDPLGVVEVYRRVRAEVSGLQLALLGSMALDDPEGWEMYRTINKETENEDDIHVMTNLTGISDVEVNAFQMLSNVAVQKSIREGFGLVVAETSWKGTPIVAGRAGGIPLQVPPENDRLLVDDVETCAARVLELLRNAEEARASGARARDWIRDRFLLPRLAADHLRLMRKLAGI